MALIDKVCDYQAKVMEQGGEFPQYYCIDNLGDLQELHKMAMEFNGESLNLKDPGVLCGSRIIIYIKGVMTNDQQ